MIKVLGFDRTMTATLFTPRAKIICLLGISWQTYEALRLEFSIAVFA